MGLRRFGRIPQDVPILPPPDRRKPEEPESFEAHEGRIRFWPSRAVVEPVRVLDPGIAVAFKDRGSMVSIGIPTSVYQAVVKGGGDRTCLSVPRVSWRCQPFARA